jgi:hypothetical protein
LTCLWRKIKHKWIELQYGFSDIKVQLSDTNSNQKMLCKINQLWWNLIALLPILSREQLVLSACIYTVNVPGNVVVSWHTLSSCTRRQKKQLDTYIQRGNLQSGGRITRRPHCAPLLIMCCCLVRRSVRLACLPAIGRSLGLRVYLPADANLTLCQRACCCQRRALVVCGDKFESARRR